MQTAIHYEPAVAWLHNPVHVNFTVAYGMVS